METTAMQVSEPLTALEIRAHVNRIQEVMKEVMQNGQHYGTIPGCGTKPTLLKPGAEKLMETFRLAVDPEVTDLSDEDHRRYRICARVTTQGTGIFLGGGVGECSSEEEKYAWREAVCKEEWDETDPAERRNKWKRGKDGAYVLHQVRTNPADLANTILKMAKKRALVDAILTVTAASDIFTQDIEDLSEEIVADKKPAVHTLKADDKDKAPVFPGGKHKGKALADVEVSYLNWYAENVHTASPVFLAAIKAEIARRKGLLMASEEDFNEAMSREADFDLIKNDD